MLYATPNPFICSVISQYKAALSYMVKVKVEVHCLVSMHTSAVVTARYTPTTKAQPVHANTTLDSCTRYPSAGW